MNAGWHRLQFGAHVGFKGLFQSQMGKEKRMACFAVLQTDMRYLPVFTGAL